MTLIASTRPTLAARRFGYAVSVGINAVLLYATNVWPGWDALPFLTNDLAQVLGLINASILVNLAVNAVYLLRDPPWLKALGDILTLAVGIVAMVGLWQVFPFDFSGSAFDWTLVARILLGVGIVGSVLGILAAMVAFARALASRSA